MFDYYLSHLYMIQYNYSEVVSLQELQVAIFVIVFVFSLIPLHYFWRS